jgi:hypothetical protein
MFLRGQGYPINADGDFGGDTEKATLAFQGKYKLGADGQVGNATFGKAASLGFELVDFAESAGTYPARPDFPPLVGNAARQARFGPLEFVPAPTAKNPEALKITNGWDKTHLVQVKLPQLADAAIEGAPANGLVAFNSQAAESLQGLWQAWADAGLLPRVLSFGGSYAPRFIRGRAHEQILSNHAFGTAFDINAAWNPLGAEPALPGTKGCVFDLVPLAHQFRFYWGGHFTRKDGMHFEFAG